MKSFNNYGPHIKALQQECAMKLRRVTLVYGYNEGRPAKRVGTDVLTGRVIYQPWRGPTGGQWIKGKASLVNSAGENR